MYKCIICGKPIDDWESYATLVSLSETAEGDIILVEWDENHICVECWGKLVKHAEEVKKLLEEVERK
mgnify:CR=1 FL=1